MFESPSIIQSIHVQPGGELSKVRRQRGSGRSGKRATLPTSIALVLLGACGENPSGVTCSSDGDCPSGRCIDSLCVAVDAGVDDASMDARVDSSVDAPLDSQADVPLDAPVALAEWILSVSNQMDSTVHPLLRISVADEDYGRVDVICDDIALPDSVPSTNIISSLTFNRNVLYASGKNIEESDTLFIVDPCTCTASVVGGYGFTYVAGITSDDASEMFGISGRTSVLIDINPASGMASLIRDLEVDWTTVGLTSAGSGSNALWAISGATDELVQFSALDGSTLMTRPLNYNFGSVGIEYHPGVDKIFACSSSGELLLVDPETGEVNVGPLFAAEGCNNLAAPFGSVACII